MHDRRVTDAIVFDWDGTLVDSLAAVLAANVQVLAECGVEFDMARYRAAYAPDWRLMYLRLGVPEDRLPFAGRRWLELYRDTDDMQPFPGAAEALRRLAEAGYVMGIVTAGDRVIVESQLQRFGFADLLPVRAYGDDGIAAKPHPEPLLRVLGELGTRDRAIHARYVGDAPDDMRMARAVGARGIGIVSMLGDRVALLEAGAAEVHPSVATWVDGLLGSGG
ncbi:MAG TPA: HAD-IA family hydrolase [Candidatus Deferrimicrobiaceae bacterium]|nr:HAD-IA family hydrolase [Candidatus Deferrimicrobiaceae bacterium]